MDFISAVAVTSVTLGLHLGSVHFPTENNAGVPYNNTNPGVYARLDDGVLAGATAGVYYNSDRKVSAYLGYTFEYGPFALTAGAITGYERPVMPLLVPSMLLPVSFEGTTPRLSFVPKFTPKGAAVIHLSIERKF